MTWPETKPGTKGADRHSGRSWGPLKEKVLLREKEGEP
jgi:hypothetical protein